MAKLVMKTPTGTKKVGLYDVRPYWLYDRETIRNGDTEKYFFQSPEGKTIADTNLKQFSTIQYGWQFELHAIRVIPNTKVSIADAENLFANTALTLFKEGDVEVFSAPALIFSAGAGLTGAVSTTATDTTIDIVSNGLPTPSAVLRLPVPLLIQGGETFNIRLAFQPAVSLSADSKVYIVLDGILKRPVKGA